MTKFTNDMSKKKKAKLNSDGASIESRKDEAAVQNNTCEYTDDQINAEIDELALTPSVKKQRIWEVDFLRGLMILFVVWDHFMWDINTLKPYNTDFFNALYQFSQSYYSVKGIRQIAQPVFVTMFVFTSGVSCSFSRSNGKRALKMTAFACLLTAVTYAVTAVIGTNLTMNFNVIHVIALSTLLWTLIEFCWSKCVKNWQKNIFGVVMTAVTVAAIVIGGYTNFVPVESENALWYFLVQHAPSKSFYRFCGGDYLPFLPDFGWFLVGAFLGKVVYKERKTLFPSVNPKFVCPITFCGRKSLWVYFGSQLVMFGLLYLFSTVLKLL